jgi:hypothetical protein
MSSVSNIDGPGRWNALTLLISKREKVSNPLIHTMDEKISKLENDLVYFLLQLHLHSVNDMIRIYHHVRKLQSVTCTPSYYA